LSNSVSQISLDYQYFRSSECVSVSQDPSNYADAPTEGIRRVLEIVMGQTIPRGSVLSTDKIGTFAPGTKLFLPRPLSRSLRLHPALDDGSNERAPRA
jgi:hypothetical protein